MNLAILLVLFVCVNPAPAPAPESGADRPTQPYPPAVGLLADNTMVHHLGTGGDSNNTRNCGCHEESGIMTVAAIMAANKTATVQKSDIETILRLLKEAEGPDFGGAGYDSKATKTLKNLTAALGEQT